MEHHPGCLNKYMKIVSVFINNITSVIWIVKNCV